MLYLRKLASKCSRCSKCKIVCPVFSHVKNELYIIKGRLLVIQTNKKIFSTLMIRSFMSCKNCFRCSEICPNTINYRELILIYKYYIFKKNYLTYQLIYRTLFLKSSILKKMITLFLKSIFHFNPYIRFILEHLRKECFYSDRLSSIDFIKFLYFTGGYSFLSLTLSKYRNIYCSSPDDENFIYEIIKDKFLKKIGRIGSIPETTLSYINLISPEKLRIKEHGLKENKRDKEKRFENITLRIEA